MDLLINWLAMRNLWDLGMFSQVILKSALKEKFWCFYKQGEIKFKKSDRNEEFEE